MCLASLCAGCISLPEFAPPSLVDRPRMLAVVADPPEISADTTFITLRTLVAGAEQVSARWLFCAKFTPFAATTQYGENVGDRGCAEDAQVLGEGLQIVAPAIAAEQQFQNDDSVRDALGTNISGSMLDQIRSQVGVAFSVEVEAQADGKRLRALKRVLISQRPSSHRNPPPPHWKLGEREIIGSDDPAAFSCDVADGGGPLWVEPGQQLALQPLFDGSDAADGREPWLESYKVLDARGVLSDREERAFYSWFARAGELDHGTTQAPDRTNQWQAPAEAGCTELWLVVRDGHGGESACGVPVAVGDADGCD
jgi:hypothetical protein